MTTHILLIALFSIAWICILIPSIIYLNTSWVKRRDKLFALFSNDTIELYFRQFYPNEMVNRKERSLQVHFKNHFSRLYGRRHYTFPLILLALLSALGLLATFFSVESWLNDTTPFFDRITISAFLGAYTWVLGDQLVRFQRSDFTSHDVYNGVYRFLVAVPLGLSLSAFVKDAIAEPFVFLLAAFPLQTLMKFSRRLVSQKLGLGESDPENGQLELQQLQGISLTAAEKYQEIGITTISELAWADPIDLMIKTNKDFSFVIDSISQSLLWVYFDKETKSLYKFSLRGAQEVCTFLDDLDSDEPKTKAAAKKTKESCADILKMDPESFIFTLLSVKEDPYAQFLFKIWA
jgi:hypothetical protein